ncbi:MAG: hypothetical protein IKL40_00470 [Clostridia bacterium]|nr:hypothetical protein [Clostridia bacterium]
MEIQMEQRKQMHLKNKLAIAILLVILCVSLTSCGGNMTDESARTELERLLPTSYEMNEIFWGKGLPTVENTSTDRYKTVKDESGYENIDEILRKASTVFSADYLASIEDAIFVGNEEVFPRYKEINGILKADTQNEGFDIKGNIVIESARIKKQNRAMMIIEADYADGGTAELSLILQNGKWYLNSPTY